MCIVVDADDIVLGGTRFRVFSRSYRDLGGLLSESELAVARLALSGATNEEIANQRGTQLSTVARQLHVVYEKLGIAGRAELASALLEECSGPVAR